jgi:hypothetical protein
MRLALDKLMEKLGVDRILSPYETQPWFLYDEAQEITCSAEVRMGPGAQDLETEIQFLYDNPPVIEEEEEDSKGSGQQGQGGEGDGTPKPKKRVILNGREQVMIMRILPSVDQKWSTISLKVRGEEYQNKFHAWEEKGCEFFRCAIEAMQMGELPNIDDLIDSQLSDPDDWGGGRRGRVGRKSPKINQAALLGMKK